MECDDDMNTRRLRRLLKCCKFLFRTIIGGNRLLAFVFYLSVFSSVFWAILFWEHYEKLPMHLDKACESTVDSGLAGWNRLVWFAATIAIAFSLASGSSKKFYGLSVAYYVPWIVVFINAQMFTTYIQYGIVSSSGDPVTASDVLYFTIITFTTVGFGDFQPCPAARLFAALHGFFGIICAALIAISLSKAADSTKNT
ncbi:MAG: hypothetical protein GC150_16425 [Rhizobiales bacterium]|nr:hypothetical protein [Hyphomicrobiales bacterium]